MQTEDKLDALKKVQKVEAPPFLWTRIQARIRQSDMERLPRSWQWAGALAFGILLLLNWRVIATSGRTTPAPVATLAAGIQLQPSNQLYDE